MFVEASPRLADLNCHSRMRTAIRAGRGLTRLEELNHGPGSAGQKQMRRGLREARGFKSAFLRFLNFFFFVEASASLENLNFAI